MGLKRIHFCRKHFKMCFKCDWLWRLLISHAQPCCYIKLFIRWDNLGKALDKLSDLTGDSWSTRSSSCSSLAPRWGSHVKVKRIAKHSILLFRYTIFLIFLHEKKPHHTERGNSIIWTSIQLASVDDPPGLSPPKRYQICLLLLNWVSVCRPVK